MPRNEIHTDLEIYNLLQNENISYTAQGSDNLEIAEALKTSSKKKNNKPGYPEFVAVVKDYVLIGEDKSENIKHCLKDDKGLIDLEKDAIQSYALNGALWYAINIAQKTNYKKIFAFGCSGSGRNLRISPLFVNERGEYIELSDIETFANFSPNNIDNFYTKEILKEKTDDELETQKLLSYAKQLHEDLRNYGNLQNKEKPLVVSGILLALREIEHRTFSLNDLNGDNVLTDGKKIYNAIKANLERSNVSPAVKKDKILSQFRIFIDSEKLNIPNPSIGGTPLKKYSEFLYQNIFKPITNLKTTEDYLGRFYGEFMSYGDNDGQSLGIVLTPQHITELFCDLAELKPTDKVIDPTCGTGGFLITAMTRMFQETIKAKNLTEEQIKSDPDIFNIRTNQLFGIELQPYMFTIATTNMILRGDGNSNLMNTDFLEESSSKLQLKGCNVGLINPPYSMGSKENPNLYEIKFIEHLLDSLTVGGKCIAIIPESIFRSDSKNANRKLGFVDEMKRQILSKHTLEGTIMMNKSTFYGVGVTPLIAVFTAGIKHPKNKKVKFVNFRDDGYEVNQHIGLLKTESAIDKKQHLLDVWFGREEAGSEFYIETEVSPSDEWIHSYFYFNDNLPSGRDFNIDISDYLTYETMLISREKDILSSNLLKNDYDETVQIEDIHDKKWKEFHLNDIFEIKKGSGKKQKDLTEGNNLYISATELNNGLIQFCSEGNTSCGNVITINDFGKAFYQKLPFSGTHITVLKPKENFELNEYHLRFIVTSINKSCIDINGERLFTFNRPVGKNRLPKRIIMLPVNEDEKIDFDYMEKYMKKQIYTTEKTVRQYLEAKIIKRQESETN